MGRNVYCLDDERAGQPKLPLRTSCHPLEEVVDLVRWEAILRE